MLLNRSCFDIPPSPDFDVLLTDPPYSRHVHKSATSQSLVRGTRHRELGFNHLTDADRDYLGLVAARAKRWGVIFSDVESSQDLARQATEQGAHYIRTLPWIRWSMPQLSGDRPAQGFEHVLVLHGSSEGPKHWNGPGSLVALEHDGAQLDHKCLRGEEKHKAEKPLDLCLDLVSWFSDPGELVYDPYTGHATIGRACQLLGRQFLGCEVDPECYARALQRLSSTLSPGEVERVRRWLAKTDDASEPVGPAAERAQRRASDKERLRWVLDSNMTVKSLG